MTQGRAKSKAGEDYRAAFIRKGLEILSRGYQRMNPSEFAASQEPEITGELVRQMKGVIEDPHAPLWMVHFDVADDPPVNDGNRLGKRRRRIDIELVHTQRGEKPRMHFEAKRLCEASSVGKYLGADGLGLFLEGEYGARQGDGGMIGYIQTRNSAHWIARIRAVLNANHAKYRLSKGTALNPVKIIPALADMQVSVHSRKRGLPSISMYHALLTFY